MWPLSLCISLVNYTRWHILARQWTLKFQWAQHQGKRMDDILISEDSSRSAVAAAQMQLVHCQAPLPSPSRADGFDGCIIAWPGLWRSGDSGLQWKPGSISILAELWIISLLLKAFLPSIKGRLIQVCMEQHHCQVVTATSKVECGPGSFGRRPCVSSWLEHQGSFLVMNHLAGSSNASAAVHVWQITNTVFVLY